MTHRSLPTEELAHELIIDALEGTISPEDEEILEAWKMAAPENEQLFRDFASIQLNMEKLGDRCDPSAEQSWKVLDSKLSGTPHTVLQRELVPVRRVRFASISVAAAVLLISGIAFFLFQGKQEVLSNTMTSGAMKITLPDQTELTLNAGTTVRYNKHNFSRDRRLILDQGEVFIHVTRHDGNQFRLHIGDIKVEDIGTSFNVSRTETHTSVVVEEGKVAMKHGNDSEVMLTQGMRGVFYSGNGTLDAAVNTDINYKAWADKRLTFNATPAEEVVSQLQKVYKSPLILRGDALRLKKLTANLHYQTLDSALEVISASLQCKVTKEQNNYVLYGNP
ncbi:FecR domain-containing protein [Pedobacter sp. JY14-1]|uniref:FecR family protein n=1 Tax=Pedobacter sp. JY14-1 TaxID=3034151 RepID=UPI0023E3502A|nr:FecR domain-containing protein [Pedobacter sp. JY14-1]